MGVDWYRGGPGHHDAGPVPAGRGHRRHHAHRDPRPAQRAQPGRDRAGTRAGAQDPGPARPARRLGRRGRASVVGPTALSVDHHGTQRRLARHGAGHGRAVPAVDAIHAGPRGVPLPVGGAVVSTRRRPPYGEFAVAYTAWPGTEHDKTTLKALLLRYRIEAVAARV